MLRDVRVLLLVAAPVMAFALALVAGSTTRSRVADPGGLAPAVALTPPTLDGVVAVPAAAPLIVAPKAKPKSTSTSTSRAKPTQRVVTPAAPVKVVHHAPPATSRPAPTQAPVTRTPPVASTPPVHAGSGVSSNAGSGGVRTSGEGAGTTGTGTVIGGG
jgi:hypothetical protein